MRKFFLIAFSVLFCGLQVFGQKITLDKSAVKILGIESQEIREELLNEVIKTTGQIEEIPSKHFDVNSPVQGKVASILAELGDFVKAGQPLAVIQSTSIANVQSDIVQFEAELELAKNTYEREKLLFEKGVSAKKDFDFAKSNLASAEARLNAAKSNLKIFGGQNSSSEQGTFTLRAPKAGTIIERNLTIGQVVDPTQILFSGVDTSWVWASADIYEKDVAKVMIGEKAFVTLDGIASEPFEGELTYVGTVINKNTRTLPVKATLTNTAGLLKPGAFIQLVIHLNEKKKSIAIPRTAILDAETKKDGKHEHIVYTREGNKFIPRKIEVESHDSSIVEVLSGLKPGETIVTQRVYQLQYGKDKGENEDKRSINFLPVLMMVLIALSLFIVFYWVFLLRKKKGNYLGIL